MTDMVQITLQQTAADTKWGKAAVTPSNAGFNVHIKADDALRQVQKAARTINALGVNEVQLTGDLWTLELQWAFYQGFCTAKQPAGVSFCGEQAVQSQLQHMTECFSWAKRIINQGPEDIYPEQLAREAIHFIEAVAAKGTVSSQILLDKDLLAAGWQGLHAVGRGSARKPAMLILDFNPTADATAPVSAALVGKGITFDSGGYSIKASESMVSMKCDMGGAATVTAALALAILQGLNKRVQLILCCAENLISSNAYKLGDIITYKNGTTVEIVNTDAEGRLVLADGLMCAAESGTGLIIDAATLTGAAMTAVGAEYNALFALDKALAQKALAYAEQEGELTWQLPLEIWHQQQCPSAYADTANSRAVKGGGAGGASNAAGFLSRFVPNDGKGWLHFDLAAAFNNSNNGYWAAGATGQGIRTISATLLGELN